MRSIGEDQARPNYSDLLVVECRDERGKCAHAQTGVAVQDDSYGASRGMQAAIRRGREAEVALVAKQGDVGKELVRDLGRTIGRTIVHDDELDVRRDRGEAIVNEVTAVVERDDDAHRPTSTIAHR